MKKLTLLMIAALLMGCTPEDLDVLCSAPKPTDEMAKRRYTYAGYTATQLKDRSSIPTASDISEGANYIDCSNIVLNAVRGVLGETSYKLSELASSPNINQFSYFNTGYWSLTGGVLAYTPANTPYNLADFAGYNHNAPPPTKSYFNTQANFSDGGGNVRVYGTINVGEIDWRNILFSNIDIDEIRMVVKQGASIKATEIQAYTDAKQQSGFEFSKYVYMSSTGTLTVSFYFYGDGILAAEIPNITSHNIICIELKAARIGTVELGAVLQAANPTWNLIYNTLISEVTQHNNTYSLYGLAIDNNDDGEGDVTRLNMTLYARKNSGTWYSAKTGINISSSGTNIVGELLPFTIDYNDVVDFELRDGA